MENILLQTPARRERWIHEPWMWLVVGAPLVVVCASIATGIIAWRSADKLVASDYYRQGLHIDKDLQRDANAKTYNMSAQLSLYGENRLQMHLRGAAKLPAVAQIQLARKGSGEAEVQTLLALRQVQPGWYETTLPAALLQDSKTWHLKVIGDDWRLTGRWQAQGAAKQRAVLQMPDAA